MNLCTHHTSSGLLCIDQKELSQKKTRIDLLPSDDCSIQGFQHQKEESQKKTRIDLLPSDNCSIQGFQPQSQSVCAKISLSEEREREGPE